MKLFSQVLVETEKKVFSIFKSMFGTDDVETICNADGIAWELNGLRIQASWKLDSWTSSLNHEHQVTGNSLENMIAAGKEQYSDSISDVKRIRQWLSDNDIGWEIEVPVGNILSDIVVVATFFARASELLLPGPAQSN